MKVLVTGGAGFIGRHIVDFYQDKAEVYVLDDLRAGAKENLADLQCKLVIGSILDRHLLRWALGGVDYVFHLAAMVSVPESMQKAVECAEINAGGTLLMLEEACRARVKKFVFSSSAAIYGDDPVIPKSEEASPAPKSPYASSKLQAEGYCNRFQDEGRIQTVCLRYFNVFGSHQNPNSQYAAAVPAFVRRAIKNEPLTIYGDGGQTRDFIYVRDVAAANAFFATQSPASGIFNLGCARPITIVDLASAIVRLANSTSEMRYAPERPGDIRHSVADVRKIRRAGFGPSCNFEEGLLATINFFRKAQQ